VSLGSSTALKASDGAVRLVADSAAPILDEAKNILGVILVFRDVTDSMKKESEITYLSYHDMLTGLYNRAFLEEETHRLDTARQLPISVIMGDVNGLKLTNDVFGHGEGDNLLVRIAGILRDCCRDEDIVARTGGDEFCILLPQTSYASAADICRRIYSHCEKVEYELPSGNTKLSISLGFATKTSHEESIHGVTKAAEDSMYRRKLLESRSQHSFLISSIRTTLFEKSFETEQHAQRLIANSKAIASALNLPDDQLNDIELFALLHDIGKIAIDSYILTKGEPLSQAEWAEMRRHPEIGFRIAQSSPDLAHIAEYILCHHERWDGTGYPQGLKGTAIPLLARILNVVDAYDAMTQDRVYRKALSKKKASAELLKNAGTQFDPNIVLVFMEILQHESD
jgi:diguanylate cyclase (GGDEF)-like protein